MKKKDILDLLLNKGLINKRIINKVMDMNAVSYYLRVLAAFIMIAAFFIRFFTRIFLLKLPNIDFVLEESWRMWIHSNLAQGIIIFLVIKYVLPQIICRNDLLETLPAILTVIGIVEFFISWYFLLYAFVSGVNCINGVYMSDRYAYFTAIMYLMWIYSEKNYYRKRWEWKVISKSYTPYFDTNGKRIAVGDDVVYWNKMYKIIFQGDIIGVEDKEPDYYLYDNSCSRVIRESNTVRLDEAVRDKDGKIIIKRWLMIDEFEDDSK